MLNEGLKNFLENKTVRQYFEACLAMQSPEVTELFRQLPPSIGLLSPISFTTKLIEECLERDCMALSDDAVEAMSNLAIRLSENCSERKSTIVDFRKMEYDILAHRDLSILMCGLFAINNIAEQDLADRNLNPDEYETAPLGKTTIKKSKEEVVNAVDKAVKDADVLMAGVADQARIAKGLADSDSKNKKGKKNKSK